MTRVMKVVPLVVLCVLIIAAPSVWAYWVQDGAAICTAAGVQEYPMVASDGAGGAIVTWHDARSGNYDIYAQRVNASGTPQWAVNGVALCTATGAQDYPKITSDGAGGAIVAWEDHRSGNEDIYAQRVNASGAVQWTTDGVALCTATGDQGSPSIASDGAGGAIVTWGDWRSGNLDIYAQRVTTLGAVQWATNGVAICTVTGDQDYPTIVSDGAGGAIVTWQDHRSGMWDIYAQKVNGNGTVQWTANGAALCAITGDQQYPTISSDGAGGAIVTWQDNRTTTADIYTQRVNASGVVQWNNGGIALCSLAQDQGYPMITSDGTGGAIVTWMDYRSGTNVDIYAQRVNASGAVQWAANGIAICTAVHDQGAPQLISDGTGGAIITWVDVRSGTNYDIYAREVSYSGVPQWAVDGVALCTATGDQIYPMIISDGAGGAIVSWWDYRNGNSDIYAQCIDAKGRVGFLAPSIYAIRDVPGDQGGKVYLSWYAARSDVYMDSQMSYYSIWRAINPKKAALALEHGASSLDDLSKLDRSSGKSVIRVEQASGRTFFWQLIQTVDAMYMPAYGEPVATLFDSTAVCKEHTYFQVVAHMGVQTVFWKSDPDSGYSVDNLPPGLPVGLVAKQSFAPVGLFLTWNMNQESDLASYTIYRGTSEGFAPRPGNRVATRTDPWWFDDSWRWNGGYYYKVSAVDIHGNESGFALLTPDAVTGTETPKAPAASYLAQNYPNPFNPTTRIAFGLKERAAVSLRIYDGAGRLVRMLAEGTRPAANYAEVWDGKDARGRAVASGIYFCRLDAGSFTQTRKMILLR